MKAQDSALTKEKILNSSIELFAEKGFSNTSVREIANHCGVNLSMISYHFGGKDGLQEAILLSFGTLIKGKLDHGNINDTIDDKIKLIVSSIVKTFSEHPLEWKIVFRELINQNDSAIKIIAGELKHIALKLFGQDMIEGKSFSKNIDLPLYVLGPAISAITISHFLYKPVIENIFSGNLPDDFLIKYPEVISNILISGIKQYFEGDSNVS